jgi:hypothetical protein
MSGKIDDPVDASSAVLIKQADPGRVKMLKSLRKYQSNHREQQKERRRKRAAQPPYPEQASALQDWWESTGRNQYPSVAEFSECVGVWPALMWSYLGGRVRPASDHRAKLYELTGLSCFAPEPHQADWIRTLELQARTHIDGLPAEFGTKKKYWEVTQRILRSLASAGVTTSNEITPANLLQHPPGYKRPQARRAAMSFMAGSLLKLGMWTATQNDDFKKALKQLYPHRIQQTGTAPTQRLQPGAMDALVVALVVRGGLGVQQVRKLHIAQIEPHGIRLGPSRLLRFGESLHQIPKPTLDAYLSEAKPRMFLFYSFRPPDYNKPISRVPITRILRDGKLTSGAGIPVEVAHFQQDFQFIPNPRRLRAHLRNFHDLSGSRTRRMMNKLCAEAKVFVLPEPYILAVVCASRLLKHAAKRQQGGRLFAYTWHGLCGRYDVTILWPVGLFQTLSDGRHKPGIARQLLRFAQERWDDGRRGLTDKRGLKTFQRLWQYWQKQNNPKGRQRNLLTQGVDKDLLGQFEITRVEIRDGSTGATWAGPLLNRTKKHLLLPLIDQLEGGPTNPRCPICGHPDRDAIDADLRSGQYTFAAVARRYGLAYGPNQSQLLWHAGRVTHNDLPGHLGSAAPALAVRCPIDLLDHAAKHNAPALAERLLKLVSADAQTVGLIEVPMFRKMRKGDLTTNFCD